MFVNLHVHTPASLLDGLCRPDQLMQYLKEIGQDACAISDHGTMSGIIEFYQEAKKAGIKPIIGMEAYVVPDRTVRERVKEAHLLLLAKNDKGLHNLMQIASDAQLNGFFHKPRTDMTVLRKYGEGIIGTSACIGGQIPQALLEGDTETADFIARQYAEIFDEFYIEIQANNTEKQVLANKMLIELARRLDLPLVVTSDSHYIRKEDAYIHELVLAINTGAKISDPPRSEQEDMTEVDEDGKKKKVKTRFVFDSPNYWVKTEDEVREFLSGYGYPEDAIEESIVNTVKIAEKCNVEIEVGVPRPPIFSVPEGYTEFSYLKKKVYDALFQYSMENDIDIKQYTERLEYELKTAEEANFAGYLLVVADYVEYAKKQNWPVGDARGSAAGWLTVFLLGITTPDPIKYDLDPDRFIAKGRKGYPDYWVTKSVYGAGYAA